TLAIHAAALVEAVDEAVRAGRQIGVAAEAWLERPGDGPRLGLVVAQLDGEVLAVASHARLGLAVGAVQVVRVGEDDTVPVVPGPLGEPAAAGHADRLGQLRVEGRPGPACGPV